MSDLDLTEAVEAAARAWFDRGQAHRMDAGRKRDDGQPWQWENLTAIDQHAYREIVLPIVTAAAPVLAAQVRESVATAIEAAKADVDQSVAAPGHYAGLGHAARIARGES